jgi:hypothetical protein
MDRLVMEQPPQAAIAPQDVGQLGAGQFGEEQAQRGQANAA